jgi:hypothetical protein
MPRLSGLCDRRLGRDVRRPRLSRALRGPTADERLGTLLLPAAGGYAGWRPGDAAAWLGAVRADTCGPTGGGGDLVRWIRSDHAHFASRR